MSEYGNSIILKILYDNDPLLNFIDNYPVYTLGQYGKSGFSVYSLGQIWEQLTLGILPRANTEFSVYLEIHLAKRAILKGLISNIRLLGMIYCSVLSFFYIHTKRPGHSGFGSNLNQFSSNIICVFFFL